jgi:hypothetical protein
MRKSSNNSSSRKSGGLMATDMNRLQGEIEENPRVPALHDEADAGVERLIVGFMRALLDEQKPAPAPVPLPSTGNEVPSFLQLKTPLVGATLAKESV